MRLVLEIKV